MKLVVTGATGMLGGAVVAAASALGHDVVALARADLDVTDQPSADAALERHEPDAVVNCAAYTDVDGAEADPDAALAVNGGGAGNVARAAAEVGARVVHVSTDYVFDGSKREPWVEADPVGPLQQYGRSKLRGEEEVAAATAEHAIVRTSWLFGAGGPNFVATMLRLGAERDEVRVVGDQRGCPTFAADLAAALQTVLLRLAQDRAAPTGTYHFVNAGEASWAEFAAAIFASSARHGGPQPKVTPITTADFPTPAKRPRNSRLATTKITADFGIRPRLWREALDDTIASLTLETVRSRTSSP
jgi:dTDP-4-dehydrorhamnose reductase